MLAASTGLIGVACSSDEASSTTSPSTDEAPTEQRFPDVIGAEATLTSTGWTFAVTVSSPYDTADRYADGWRVVGADGTEYGFRMLTHDHAAEQPFTRTLADVEIPAGVDSVTIEARDQEYGYGGATFNLKLPTN